MEFTEFFLKIKTLSTMAHVGGVIFAMGGALISDYLFSFFSKDKKLSSTELSTLSILSKIVLYGLGVVVISGIALFLSNPEGYMASTKFLVKMSILAVLILNGYFLNKFIWPHLLNKKFFTSVKERNVRRFAFASGAVSVVSWILVFILGSLKSISYSFATAMSAYFLILIFAITIAIFVEKKELN